MSAPTATGSRTWLAPTLHGYRRAWLGADIVAGLSAGAVVVPQAMAYATIANMPVQVGLYTCMVPMFVYAMLGGSRAMSVSTTSTIATLTATTLVSSGVAANSDNPVPDLMALVLIVGLILLAARLLRLGNAVEYISKPTIIGIQVGVGATVAVGQVPKLLGVEMNETGAGFIRSLIADLETLPDANPATVLLSIGSIAALVLLRRLLPKVPGPLVVVAAGILLVAFAGLKDTGVALIAPVPQGFPPFQLPSFAHVAGMLPGALAIAVMAFLESSAVARGIREAGETPIDSNRELFATGAANTIGAFFQVLPAAGGFSQSAVNKNAGAKSQVATLVTVGLAVLVALFLGPVLSLMPQATLAALVFVAVVGLIDIKGLARLWRLNRADFWIAAITAFVGLTAGLLLAVAVGVVGTFVVVFRELNKVRLKVDDVHDGALVVQFEGPLYTANAQPYESAILNEVDAADDVRVLVLDAGYLRVVSVTVLDALADFENELTARGIELRLAVVPGSAATVARRGSWFQKAEADGRVYSTVDAAVHGPGAR
ncbi:STAS domain-containing protein [Microbacterium bovistercoris]|uniref:STAS domain-containing protein n=1 Tax=Microbacterium bovistercoris TaxID=2293570 RepID=A0A371NPA0_9MICO|nr:SulP family inorganic anion transporter [Microbacterium bovistercoris]REJ04014.1 STAS domain-containing protein [Microbacterium bovistercoris]